MDNHPSRKGDTYRKLGGRTAADLAAGGVHRPGTAGPVDVDAILDSIADGSEQPEDRWGGANLDPGDHYDPAGIDQAPGRTYSGS